MRDTKPMKIPSADDLSLLRKGLRKRKVPNVFDGLWCSEPGIGGMKVTVLNDDYQLEWVTFDGGVKSDLKTALWTALCNDPALEFVRYEIGCLVAEILQIQQKAVMDSIGHPLEAIREAEPYRKASEAWKHWGIVKAGHMLGL